MSDNDVKVATYYGVKSIPLFLDSTEYQMRQAATVFGLELGVSLTARKLYFTLRGEMPAILAFLGAFDLPFVEVYYG